ncbi:hypothetical protein PTTG_30597, partial [Puccinia triticina 1-1 BBBD Race 1]
QQERQSHRCVYRLPHWPVTLRPFPSSPSWPGRRKRSCSAKQKRVEPTGPNDWKSTGDSAKQEPSTKHQSRAVQVARSRLARVDEGRALTISTEDAAEDKAPCHHSPHRDGPSSHQVTPRLHKHLRPEAGALTTPQSASRQGSARA